MLSSHCHELQLLVVGIIFCTTMLYINIIIVSLEPPFRSIVGQPRTAVPPFQQPAHNHSANESHTYLVQDTRPGGSGCSIPSLPIHSPLTERFVRQQRLPTPRPCPPSLTASDADTGWLWIRPDRRELTRQFNGTTADGVLCLVVPLVPGTADDHNSLLWSMAQSLAFGERVQVAKDVKFAQVHCTLRAMKVDSGNTGQVVQIERTVVENHFFVRDEGNATGFPERDGSTGKNSTVAGNQTRPIDSRQKFTDPSPAGNQTLTPIDSRPARRFNVILLGIDSVSRLNFHRQMPRTSALLTNRLGDAVELLGYNKVGDNTFPNLMAALTGLHTESGEHHPTTCNQTSQHDHFADDHPLVWREFARHGFRTAFAEDMAELGTFSFRRRPSAMDAWLRPLVLELESLQSDKCCLYACLGHRRPVDWLLAYVRAMVRRAGADRTRRRPLFGVFWSAAQTHDYLNQPQQIDADYERLLEELSSEADDNFVLLISDHGLRWGAFRNTYQGMMEERQPLLVVVPPRGFRERYPRAYANLKENRRRLTTPFDLHETLLDLAEVEVRLDDGALRRREEKLVEAVEAGDGQQLPRGISLFLPVPERRTCQLAGIAPHWCTCLGRPQPLTAGDVRVRRAAGFVVRSVNELLLPHRAKCASLALHSISYAAIATSSNMFKPGDVRRRTDRLVDVRVRLRTRPGRAQLEATVRMMVSDGRRADAVEQMELVGPVSRTNSYGGQSWCVADALVKLYCFCSHS